MFRRVNRRILYTFFSLVVVVGGTVAAIQYAKGNYRITQQGFVPATGLLSANSSPTGAEVLINGKLVTATNGTLYLEPGTYQVEIRKDNYQPWQKTLTVQKELVTQTNALLFPTAPSLSPLTFSGIQNLSPSPDGQKIIFYSSSNTTATRNGLYLLELSSSPLQLQRGPRQISNDPSSFALSGSRIIWSPDSSEALLVAGTNGNHQVMLNLDRKADLETLTDVSFQSKQILSQWESDMYLRERQYLKAFPPEVIAVATESAKNVYFSPDKKRLLYTATQSATLPEGLIPPVPATNTQPEERKLVAGNIYVYDKEEDKNFKVGTEAEIMAGKLSQAGLSLVTPSPSPSPKTIAKKTAATTNLTVLNATGSAVVDKILLATDLDNPRPLDYQASPSAFLRLQASDSAKTANLFNTYHSSLFTNTFQWMPDSNHLIYIGRNRIQVEEYDASNNTTVYAGPYSGTFVYPWPDGTKLLILTSFSPDIPNNLYGIELK